MNIDSKRNPPPIAIYGHVDAFRVRASHNLPQIVKYYALWSQHQNKAKCRTLNVSFSFFFPLWYLNLEGAPWSFFSAPKARLFAESSKCVWTLRVSSYATNPLIMTSVKRHAEAKNEERGTHWTHRVFKAVTKLVSHFYFVLYRWLNNLGKWSDLGAHGSRNRSNDLEL